VSRLDDLSPDLHAALALLLRQRKSYAELATLLGVQAHAVHDRAHAALALLAPRQARELSREQRERVGEYLLGQQDAEQQRESRAYLASSAPARAWAQALTDELAPLAPHGLAEIPPPAAPSSRVGGALILGGLAVVVIVAVLLIVGIGGGGGSSGGSGTNASAGSTGQSTSGASGTGKASTTDKPVGTKSSSAAEAGSATNTTAGASTATTPAAGTGAAAGTHGKALPLTPPNPAASKALGVAYVLSEKGQRAFYLFTKDLPALPEGAFYAVWLEGAASAPAYPLGSLPAAGSDGLVEGGGPLPTDAASYTRVSVTQETSHHPVHPGPIVLSGAFSAD
jgi:hypothetical protein